MKFVQSRESQNRLERKGSKSTKKGVGDMSNLNFSINYDKTKSKETEEHTIQNKGGKSQGGLPILK